MQHILTGKRVLITQADAFMGPALCEVFAEQGAEVVASTADLAPPEAAAQVVAQAVKDAGPIDVLVANLAYRAPTTPAVEVDEDEWRAVFAALVDPLPRLVRAAAPAMIQRRSGKVLVVGSASALRGMKRASTYSAARGAQLAYVQAVGVELAPHQVQVNAIAQNFGKRVPNTLLTRVSSQTSTTGRRSANATRQVVPSPGSMVAVRWLMRTTVPTTV
jgi:2-keto-3-deoxy-L-fuconate dehydrogenase